MNLLVAFFALTPCTGELIADARQLAGCEPDRVGRIIVEGNTTCADRVIRSQIPLRPGQVLQYSKLEEGRKNLLRLGIFDLEDPPRVEVVPNQADSRYKDVRVRVKETPTGRVYIGPYATPLQMSGSPSPKK